MYDYLVCAVFWLLFVIALVLIGGGISRGKKEFSENLILGYVIYSSLVAIGGIIIQIMSLPWICFAIYLAVVWIALACVAIYRIKSEPDFRCEFNIKKHIKENWVVYGVWIVLVGMLFLYFGGFWLGNHLDDGYYVTKVATLPFDQPGGNMMYPVGVESGKSGFDPYIINTWEIEASVYVRMLGVEPTLYLRLFQSAFHYLLFACVIKGFSKKIMEKLRVPHVNTLAQYPVIIALLFDMYYLFLGDTYFLRLRDMFHFNSGMFLGISIVKTMTILLLLYFFVDKEKISLNMVGGVIAISVLLMSKSTIALPVLEIVIIACILSWLFWGHGKIGRWGCGILVVIYLLAAIIIPNDVNVQSTVYRDIQDTLQSPVIWVCVVIFIWSFSLKSVLINKINTIFIGMLLLIAVPQINDIFELFSVYTFAGGRAYTTVLYCFIVVNSIYLCLLLCRQGFSQVVIRRAYKVLGVVLSVTMVVGFKMFGGGVLPDAPRAETGLRHSLSVIKHNIYFMPDSTIALGRELDKLSREVEEQLCVISPKIVIRDGAMHAVAIMMRTYAPGIISASAIERFPINDGTALSDYKQTQYDAFVADPTEETAAAFEEETNSINPNCVVVTNPNCAPWLEKMGFSSYSEIGGAPYYIWVRTK